MIENSAESPAIFAYEQPDFFGQSADKKTFSANRDSFTSKLSPFWSYDADSWLALCEAEFTISGIEVPVLKFMRTLKTLITGKPKKL